MRVVGDAADMLARLRLVLPPWFADETPVLDGLLAGLASSWVGLHGLLDVVRRQSRRLTATEGFLDLSGADLFGGRLRRRDGEADEVYRARMTRALRRSRATRSAVVDAVAEVGGAARVFEPAQPGDTGVYGGPGFGFGVAGGWGSLTMPLECLVTIQGGTDVMAAVAEALPAGGAAWVRAS